MLHQKIFFSKNYNCNKYNIKKNLQMSEFRQKKVICKTKSGKYLRHPVR